MILQSNENISISPSGKTYKIPSVSERKVLFREMCEKVEYQKSLGRKVVVVQGMGFVGVAVASVIASASDNCGNPRYFVIGVDLPNPNTYWKVAEILDGMVPFISPDRELSKLIYNAVCKVKNLSVTTSEEVYALADVIVVDVHFDIINRSDRSPYDIEVDIKSFELAVRTLGHYMQPDALVLIETTVPVGTCEKIVLPILTEERLKRGITEQVFLSYAYERVMPGYNYVDSVRSYWRTFAGVDKISANKAREFLSSFIDVNLYPLWELEDTNSSELAKLLENSYRAVNIAFIYEWTLLAEQIGINLFDVINSIRVRKGTHDNIRFPGFGVGGYCLTKDSLLAQWSSTKLFGKSVILNITLNALKINYFMPLHTLKLISELAGELRGKTILVCGVSYLPEVADTRNSPTEILVDELMKLGAGIIVHDPYLKRWMEKPDIQIMQNITECVKQVDGVVFAVAHSIYCNMMPQVLLSSARSPLFLVDANNVMSDEKARVFYDNGWCLLGVGKGHWRKQGYQCQR